MEPTWTNFIRLQYRVIAKQMSNGLSLLNKIEATLRRWDILEVSTREEYWPIEHERVEELRDRGYLVLNYVGKPPHILCRVRVFTLQADPEFAIWDEVRALGLKFCSVEKISRWNLDIFSSAPEDNDVRSEDHV